MHYLLGKETFVQCGLEMNLRNDPYLLDNFSDCLDCLIRAPENFQVSSTEFQPMTSAIQCSALTD